MLNVRQKLAMHHWTRLGQCPACMRTACLFAMTSTTVAALATVGGLRGTMLAIFWTAAAGFVTLWAGHVVVFSRNQTRALAVRHGGGARVDAARRATLFLFLRILFVAATVTSLPKSLRAQNCSCYSDSNCYCPAEFPQCVFNPSTGEAICCGSDAIGCAGPTQTWCCPPGSQCYGTDAQCMANQ